MLSILAFVASQSPGQADAGIKIPAGTLAPKQEISQAMSPSQTAERSLTAAFLDVDAPIVFDLPDFYLEAQANPRQQIPKLPNDVGSLTVLAALDNRHLARVQGAYVVHRRRLGSDDVSLGLRDAQVYGWLDNLLQANPSKFRELLQGGADLNTLDSEGQSILRSDWAGLQNARYGAVSGIPVSVSLGIFPRLARNGVGDNSSSTFHAFRRAVAVPQKALPKNSNQPETFSASSDGTLDFGKGSVLTVNELGSRASAKFGFGYVVDSRYSQYPVFVKGKFTQPRIEAALNLLGTSGPSFLVQPKVDKLKLNRIKRRVLEHCLAELTKSGDVRVEYLLHILDNPGACDPEILAKFGYSAADVEKATTVSLNLALTISSNTFNTVDPRTGQQRFLPTSGTEVFNGN